MMFTKSYARISFLLILTLLVLIIPSLIRESDNYIGEDAYFYSRLSEMIKNNDFNYDELSYSGRPFTYSFGQPVIFLFFTELISEFFTVKSLPLIFGILSLILFYLILKEFSVDPNVRYLSVISLIISPPFIYIFSSYTKFTVITLLLLLAIYLFIKKDNNLNYISYLLFFIIPFFGYQYSILILLISFIYCIKQKKLNKFYIILITSLLSLTLIYLPYFAKYGISESTNFDKPSEYQFLFSDLGSNFGVSIFIIFLAVFGLNYLWKDKYKHLTLYLILLLFIILLFYFPSFIVYLNFMLAFLSALGIIYLLRSRWESEAIRKLTMWLLVIGLIFSTITFLGENSKQEPNSDLYESLKFLNTYDTSESVVLSHYSYGKLINSISNKKNMMDTDYLYAPKLNERYDDSQKLFHTRNINIAFNLTDKYNIEYILITKKMKEGLIWNQEDEELLFLLNSANEFKKIYSNDETEIWRIRK